MEKESSGVIPTAPHPPCCRRTEFPRQDFGGTHAPQWSSVAKGGSTHTLGGVGKVLYHLLMVLVKISGSSHGFKVPGEAIVKGIISMEEVF